MPDRYAHYRKLRIDRPDERILRITFDDPKTKNALDAEAHRELAYIWRDIAMDPETSVVLVTGAGDAFSAGGSFDFIEAITCDPQIRLRAWKETRDLVYNMIDCSRPVVSAMRGPAVGAGLVVGLLADVSIASETARILDGHTRLGVAAGDVAVLIWPLLCGLAKARYYLLTCEPIDGREAERIGLVSLCVEDHALEARAMAIARQLRDGAPAALRLTKYALANWLRAAGPLFDVSTALEFLGFTGQEVREGLASLREKRPPRFDPDCPI